MIRIELGSLGVERIRMAHSPLHEIVGSLHLLHRFPGEAPWPYRRWAETARTALAADPRLAPLALYGQLYGHGHPRTTPDVFTPVAVPGSASLDDELRRLCATPPEAVAAGLAKHYPEGIPDYLAPYDEDPVGALARLAQAMALYWQAAIAPRWPVLRIAVEEEILTRARSLALHGPEVTVGGLSDSLTVSARTLLLAKPKDSRLDAGDRRFLIVPLIFAGGKVAVSTDDPETLMISYQTPGAIAVDETAESRRPDVRLAALLGSGRAAVLQSLAQGSTTTHLAAVLGLSASTVSEHLTVLREAGVVQRRRVGRHVLYELAPAGQALLDASPGSDSGVTESLREVLSRS